MPNNKSCRSRVLLRALLAIVFAVPSLASCNGGGTPASVSPALPARCVAKQATGPITLSVVPSRINGVAPLSIFFDASCTTANATAYPFHELEFQWDFGDRTNGNLNLSPPVGGTSTWNTGSNAGGNSRNAATGPEAAHVYETPGTYAVTLTATDGTQQVSNSCAQIVVQDPDIIFAGTNTICVAATSLPVAGSDGCPVGANTAQQPNFATAISSYAKTGKRVLFKHDDTFTETASAIIASTGPGTIGMYGSGAKPIIHSSGTSESNAVIRLGAPSTLTMQDWRIMDLEIDGQSISGQVGIDENGDADQITLLRMNIHNIGDAVFFNGGIVNLDWRLDNQTHMYDQITIQDGNFHTFLNGYGFFIFANHFAAMGNYLDDATAAQHVFRIMHTFNGFISNNTIGHPALTKQTFTLRSTSSLTNIMNGPATYTQAVVVSDNKFIGGLSNQPVTVGPSTSTDVANFKDIIFERNWYTGAGAACCAGMLTIEAQDMTVRNEVMDITGAGSLQLGINVESATGNSPASNNVRLYNNTIFSNDAADFFAMETQTLGASPAKNITAKNNLGYAPNGTAGSGFLRQPGSWGTPTTASNNSSTMTANAHFTAVPPTAPAQFRPTCTGTTYPCAQGVIVPVWSDFFRVPQTTSRSLGAVLP